MDNRVLLTPLRYLRLRDERGRRLLMRNLIATAAVTLMFTLPFLIASHANYFHKDGFVDKVGAFSSVLTGFYVAGLLAVATFSEKLGGLDAPIEVGKIILKTSGEPDQFLTRRQYVCTIFGYLAFLSLAITLISITTVILSSAIPARLDIKDAVGRYPIHVPHDVIRGIAIACFGIVVAHLSVVTCHALYYLIDRLYAKKPELLPEQQDTSGH